MPSLKSRHNMPLPLHAPVPTPDQSAVFAAWYAKRFGVVLDPTEASARLHHVAGLFLLLGGEQWIQERRRQRQKSCVSRPRRTSARRKPANTHSQN